MIYCLHINWGGLWCPGSDFDPEIRSHFTEPCQCKEKRATSEAEEKKKKSQRIFYLGLLHRGPSKMHWRWSTSSFLFLQNSTEEEENEWCCKESCYFIHRPSKAKPNSHPSFFQEHWERRSHVYSDTTLVDFRQSLQTVAAITTKTTHLVGNARVGKLGF